GADAGERFHRFFRLVSVEALLHQLGIAKDGREWGPELVTHIGHELRLVLACNLELTALLVDLSEQVSVLERDGRLVGEGLHKADNRWLEVTLLTPLEE